jgi:hypothetical protein
VRFACLLLAVAACHPPGLTLEVLIDDPNLKKVELFVGERCSGDCPYGTVPPSLPAMSVDRAYVVADPVPWSIEDGDFHGGKASFRLETAEATTVGILVVLGYDAQDQVRWSSTFRGVAVPASGTVHWQVKLTATTPIEPTPAPAGSARIARWQQPSKRLPSCLLLEHWDSSTTAYRELVVPDTDRDCDEVPDDAECAPWVPNAMNASPEVSDTSCVLTATLANSQAPVCVLGGPECTEPATTPGASCVPVAPPHCVSSSLCGCGGNADVMGCLTEKIGAGVSAGALPHFKCAIQLQSNGEACSSSLIQADAGAYLSSTGSTKCSGVTFTEAKLPVATFSSALVVDAASRLKIERFDTPCKIAVAYSGTSMPQRRLALARIALDNGNAVMIPAVIDLKATGCAEESQCSFHRPADTAGYDSIWHCIEQKPSQPLCPADADNSCQGPSCNGACCKAGERCTPNGCMCGDGPACGDGEGCEGPGPGYCGYVCCSPNGPCPI